MQIDNFPAHHAARTKNGGVVLENLYVYIWYASFSLYIYFPRTLLIEADVGQHVVLAPYICKWMVKHTHARVPVHVPAHTSLRSDHDVAPIMMSL